MGATRILIAGIGGVGGYFGGLMAKRFHNHKEVEIHFLARGPHLKAIQETGLRVVQGEKDLLVHPKSATDDARRLGTMDFILVCMKSFALEEAMEQLKPCIDDRTVILPLLNGVDSRERILKKYPGNLVCDGCVYIIARLTGAGRVENLGNIQKLFFGKQGQTNAHLELLQQLFVEAGIESTLSENIETIIWEKFIFISAMAGSTTYYDEPVGPIVSDASKRDIVTALVQECSAVARKKGIVVDQDMPKKVLDKLDTLPFEATSSLHSDFRNKKPQTEFGTLVEYVLAEAERLAVKTPTYRALVSSIKS